MKYLLFSGLISLPLVSCAQVDVLTVVVDKMKMTERTKWELYTNYQEEN